MLSGAIVIVTVPDVGLKLLVDMAVCDAWAAALLSSVKAIALVNLDWRIVKFDNKLVDAYLSKLPMPRNREIDAARLGMVPARLNNTHLATSLNIICDHPQHGSPIGLQKLTALALHNMYTGASNILYSGAL